MVANLIIFKLLLFTPFLPEWNDSIIDPYELYTYERMERDLNLLHMQYPDSIKIQSIGQTPFGRHIYAVKLGRGKKHILFIGSHHGREWLTTTLLMKMVETYASEYEKNGSIGPYSTTIFDEVSIWFVPMLNPDGVTIQQGKLSEFPLDQQIQIRLMNGNHNNFLRWKANGEGIDLNRQYPAGWNELPYEPPFPSYQFFKGNRPIEAKEVQIITKFTKKIDPAIAVSYHSSGREIYWYYENKNVDRDRNIAEKVSELTHYKLAKPPVHAMGGGFTDWFITTFGRPAMTIEIAPTVIETQPPISVITEEWERNNWVGIMLATEALNLKNK